MTPAIQSLVNVVVFLFFTISFAAIVDWLMNNKDKRDERGDAT